MSALGQVLALRRDLLARSQSLRDIREAAQSSQIARAAPGIPGTPAVDFAGTLSAALKKVNAVQQRSGDLQAGYERGEVTDIAQVMLARQEAGLAFEATLQVRNKLLNAYQEIMRMGA
ncbi:MAG: flagellar hook-basal body complex protein FliE [Erythrobacter sp.]|nr:flagellar hook-basal body complex protein FliE [Erythrobacter sp.]